MKELMGGLWLAGLLAGALWSISAMIVFFLLGTIAGLIELSKQARNERKENSWRAEYPSYKY